MNQHAAKPFGQNAVEFVLLLWDEPLRRMAIRPITKKDSRAYLLAYDKKGKGGGAGFFAKTFFDHINYDYTETRTHTAEWNDTEGILEVQLPADAFKAETESKVLSLAAQKQGAK